MQLRYLKVDQRIYTFGQLRYLKVDLRIYTFGSLKEDPRLRLGVTRNKGRS